MVVEFINLLQAGVTEEQALVRLTDYYYRQGQKVMLLVQDEAQAQELNELLWSYEPASFLPHAIFRGPDSLQEPVVIALEQNPAYAAQVLLVADHREELFSDSRSKVVEFIPREEGDALEACRERFRRYRRQPGCQVIHTTALPA